LNAKIKEKKRKTKKVMNRGEGGKPLCPAVFKRFRRGGNTPQNKAQNQSKTKQKTAAKKG
jgi:hypothetical protein